MLCITIPAVLFSMFCSLPVSLGEAGPQPPEALVGSNLDPFWGCVGKRGAYWNGSSLLVLDSVPCTSHTKAHGAHVLVEEKGILQVVDLNAGKVVLTISNVASWDCVAPIPNKAAILVVQGNQALAYDMVRGTSAVLKDSVFSNRFTACDSINAEYNGTPLLTLGDPSTIEFSDTLGEDYFSDTIHIPLPAFPEGLNAVVKLRSSSKAQSCNWSAEQRKGESGPRMVPGAKAWLPEYRVGKKWIKVQGIEMGNDPADYKACKKRAGRDAYAREECLVWSGSSLGECKWESGGSRVLCYIQSIPMDGEEDEWFLFDAKTLAGSRIDRVTQPGQGSSQSPSGCWFKSRSGLQGPVPSPLPSDCSVEFWL